MRSRRAVSALVVAAAGLAVTAAVRRFAGRRSAPVPALEAPAPLVPVADRDAVVLPFARATTPSVPRPAAPSRCGDTGGRTKAGAPCAARATSAGRCHHPRVAA